MRTPNELTVALQWMTYPLVMSAGLTAYLLLQPAYPGTIWIAYVPVLIATLCVTGLEVSMPHHTHWRPSHSEVSVDLIYMLLVQVGVPLIMGLALVTLLHGPLSDLGGKISNWWPHHWSLLAQGGLMLLAADFFSYWLHRLTHTLPLLWRFHAVHHSPEKLYWLNVGRFHPLEKVLQYMLSAFPFMLLGVSQDVIGLYFVFYGINGFFQHSNIEIKYGVLNYVVSSAALHRWHHSPNPHESNNNYGNNLIIWDLLFHTWFLPRDQEINSVGSGLANYPQSFIRQLSKPFESFASFRAFSASDVSSIVRNLVFRLLMGYLKLRHWRPFVKKAKEPAFHQKNVLRNIIGKNKKTHFANQHRFDTISDESSFKRAVPILQYEDLAPLIYKQEFSGAPALLPVPALFYARTSGTTGHPKDIPITARSLAQFKRQQRLLCSYQHQVCPEAFSGKALAIVSPAVEGHLHNGTPYGSVSGYIYKTMPAFIRARNILPAEVFDISDYDLKYRVIIRIALAETNITYLGAANPSTFIRMRDVWNKEWEGLLMSLETGTLAGAEKLPSGLKSVLAEIIKPEPKRVKELRDLSTTRPLEYKDLWPSIRLLTTWTGGNCQIAFLELGQSLPVGTKCVELGYVASEFRGTLTCDPVTNAGLPILDELYYEFIEKDRWEDGTQDTLNLCQLEKSKRYYIIVTTEYGLYRYFINDLVEVCGNYENTPLLKFCQKGKGVTNITGEKVYESQINEAVLKSCQETQQRLRFQLTIADSEQARYDIFLELEQPEAENSFSLSRSIDKRLSELNVEYSQKRKSGRLRAPRVYLLKKDTSEAYKRYQIARGQREGQYKLVTLLNKSELRFPIQDYLSVTGEGAYYAAN